MSNLTTIEVKAFVPARDFALSKQSYQDLGFELAWSNDNLAYLHHGNSSFLPIVIPIDREGLDPNVLAEHCERGRAKVLLCMPRVHNPTTRQLSKERRIRVVELIHKFGLSLIEDDVYGPSPDRPDASLSTECPGRSYYVGSLSKSLAPGLRIGFIAAPASAIPSLSAIGQSLSWMVSPLMAELAAEWITTGLAEKIAEEHRNEVFARQEMVTQISVLATPGTVRRDHTHDLIIQFAASSRVTLVGSEDLARLGEAHMCGNAVADADILAEIAPAFVDHDGKRTDTIVLACTHYPLLLERFRALAPWPVNWIDPAPAIARRVVQLIGGRDLQAQTPDGVAIFTGRYPEASLRAALESRRFHKIETAAIA